MRVGFVSFRFLDNLSILKDDGANRDVSKILTGHFAKLLYGRRIVNLPISEASSLSAKRTPPFFFDAYPAHFPRSPISFRCSPTSPLRFARPPCKSMWETETRPLSYDDLFDQIDPLLLPPIPPLGLRPRAVVVPAPDLLFTLLFLSRELSVCPY